MLGEFRNRLYRREDLFHTAPESALLQRNALLFTFLTLLVLFVGVVLIPLA